MILSMAMAQTQIEQANRPSITDFTTQWAERKSPQTERSAATGRADCATSAGFMNAILFKPIAGHKAARRAVAGPDRRHRNETAGRLSNPNCRENFAVHHRRATKSPKTCPN